MSRWVLLESDLGQSDVTRDGKRIGFLVGQAVAELQQVLIVDSHLEALGFDQDDQVEVAVGHEGKVNQASFFLTPTPSLAVVTDNRVHAVTKPETRVKVHHGVTSVV